MNFAAIRHVEQFEGLFSFKLFFLRLLQNQPLKPTIMTIKDNKIDRWEYS